MMICEVFTSVKRKAAVTALLKDEQGHRTLLRPPEELTNSSGKTGPVKATEGCEDKLKGSGDADLTKNTSDGEDSE